MPVVIVAIWLSILLFLVLAVTALPKKGEPKHSAIKRNVLLVFLAIHIVCSLVFIVVLISAVFDVNASI